MQAEYFKKLNARLTKDICTRVLSTKKTATLQANEWHDDINITVQYCKTIGQGKIAMLTELRRYALGNRYRMG